jgi:hypothetical protein
MKTLKKSLPNNEIRYIRVKNEEVDSQIRVGYNFCSKEEWKKNVRDLGKEEVIPKKEKE